MMAAETKFKCITCRKEIFETQNSIGCDECEGYQHVRCAGLKIKDFDALHADKNSTFSCKYCLNYKCGKCNKPVYKHQNAVQCDHDECDLWYHLRCSPFTQREYLNKKSRLHTDTWFCPTCSHIPFSNVNHQDFISMYSDDDNLNDYFKALTDAMHYDSTRCSVCKHRISSKQKQKAFPCPQCMTLVHRKCSNISTHDLLHVKPKHLANWSCTTCLSEMFPLNNTEDTDVASLTYNSLVDCPCNNQTVSIPLHLCETFKYAKQFTQKDSYPTGHDPYELLDLTYDINVKCNYYNNHDFHKLTASYKNCNKKPFMALHTNIQSLNHNFDPLEQLCTDLDFTPDIIAVTETWNSNKSKDKFIPKKLPGYDKYNGIQGTTLKSGCGFYIREGLKYIDRKDLDLQHYDDLNEFQCKFIEIIHDKKSNIIFGVVYRHPKKSSDNTFNEKLSEILDKLSNSHKTKIILGDFNYNLLNQDRDEQVRKFTDIMYTNNLQALIDKPTRVVKGQKPTLIDNIFTNAVDKDIVTGNLLNKISDHMPNFILMKDFKFGHQKMTKTVRLGKNVDIEQFRKDVSEIDLTPVLHLDLDEIFNYHHDQFTHVMNKHYPETTLSNQELHWRQKPWISKHMQNLIHTKHILYEKYLRKKDKFWYGRYCACKKQVETLIETSKKEHFKKYFERHLSNSRKSWKAINEIIYNKFSKGNSEIYLDDEGNIITNQKTVANRFNKFYTNVAKNLLKDLGKPNTKFQDYLKNPNEHSIFLNETNPDEVSTLLSKLDITKSGDLYGITPKILTEISYEIAPNLAKIFNMAMRTGKFPTKLKIAKVIPIHKGDSKMLAANYRPISLLPIIGKVFEKILFSRITEFVKKYDILYQKQYGFQKGKSTEHALIDIHEKILNSFEKNESPCCILLDFAKAFDTVDHQILLSKLYHYGIRGTTHSLLTSYLTDRQQCVQVNNCISDMEFISHGVPQGSILGPLLFLLYINDIAQSSKILQFYLFADDTTIFHSHKNPKTLESIINNELLHVTDWLIANKLSLNVKKTKVLLFRPKNESRAAKINIILNGTPIEESEFAKYLGVIIDNKLSFEHHINQVKSKLIKGNAIIAKVRNYIPRKLLINVYNAHIQPHINYGLNVWGHTADKYLNIVRSQQRKAVRLINFKNRYFKDTDTLFKEMNALTLSQNLSLNNSKLLWQVDTNNMMSDLYPLFQKRQDDSHTFFLPYRRLHLTQSCISYRGVQVWNKIPKRIREANTLDTFKNNYKNYLLGKESNPVTRTNRNATAQRYRRNNNYGRLGPGPRPVFRSRWDDGPIIGLI